MKIIKDRELQVRESFSLSGSTASLNRMAKNCGISIGESPEVVAAKKEINDFYNAEIAKLEAERKKKLANVKD
ncbi:hypothetical protein [Vibrio hippocampi]|uniref:hypothetical protein n=1 Tax=Vibrio hippocampi TaxID=654686 RepID=UPI001F43B9F5|nr:hypothetical protein [Vibrio hippocampi]